MSESFPTKEEMALHPKEREAFIRASGDPESSASSPGSLCFKRPTRLCFMALGGIGVVFVLLGILLLSAGRGILENKILNSMALSPGSDRFASWLRPPVQPHLSAYAFHVENPEGVLKGEKPRLKEVGPFVYSSTTLKDTDNSLRWSPERDALTYQPRKIYKFVPELSEVKDPENTFVTVPNIPFWTYLNNVKKKGGALTGTLLDTLRGIGSEQPFVNVSLAGLLWGYHEEIPCLKLSRPSTCVSEDDPFGDADPFGGGDDDDLFSMDDDFMSSSNEDDESEEEDRGSEEEDKKSTSSSWDQLVKPKAEFIDCKCNWGLFRDRNVTLRKPVEFMTGLSDLGQKGRVLSYDGKKKLGWWKKDSTCDVVRGQDASTLPPGLSPDMSLEIFIALMCRPINLVYEKDTEHAGIRTYRFIPPVNALGHHADPDPNVRNPDNECYCPPGFECFKSGVYSMEPCKRETSAPLALSYPHFYQADPSFLEGVEGLSPMKEKHEFFMDVVPEFGFPLAIRPRFQLNVVIGDMDFYNGVRDVKKTVLPFLWAQDGFDEPSEPMAEAIQFGLEAPQKLPLLMSVVCFLIGAILVLACLSYFLYVKRAKSAAHQIVPK
eukprot:TRINITY_DN659_c0_g1_i6.p1 TRINITY_DN659_c0_g1~~TRINITY_DN659_c0_g1_i6.p1  ORF type:complete len:605 (-),score=179.40 TRINITY_DN659_c0_g1_i6:570-2384(-)